MPLDHRREFLVGVKPLPLQALLPPLEEGAGPARRLVAPELPEGLLEPVGGVESLIGLEQLTQARAAVVRNRTGAKGDSTTFVVCRWRQRACGNWSNVTKQS